jgi:hypothetical protein
MVTGPHSFTDPTGVEWDIVGYSRVCGPAYVDCRSKDGVALTVRPLAYLAPAGLSLPADAEPPVRAATSSEKSNAHELAERMVGGPVEKPKVKRARKKKPESEGAQVIPLPTDDPVRAFDTALSIPTPTPTAGRYVMLTVSEAGEGFCTSWETWEEAHDVFPIEAGFVLEDSALGHRWIGPCACECGNCLHARMGCIECGDKTGACTPTACSGGEEPSQAAPGDTAAPGTPAQKARVINAHREGYDVLIARPSAWGNPYSHLPDTAAQYVVETRERAIDLYREWMRQRIRDGEPGLVQALASLHGLRLGCYCAPQACHGDVLVDAAAWAAEKLADFSTST